MVPVGRLWKMIMSHTYYIIDADRGLARRVIKSGVNTNWKGTFISYIKI